MVQFLKANSFYGVLVALYLIRVIHLASGHDPWRYVVFGAETRASLAADFLLFALLIADVVLKQRGSKRGVPADVWAAVFFAAAILESIAMRTDSSMAYFTWLFAALAVVFTVGALVRRYSKVST